MSTKIYVRSLLVFFSLSMCFGLVSCDFSKNEVSDAVDALPLRSSIIFKVNDLEELTYDIQQNAIYKELDTLPLFGEFREWISSFPIPQKQQTLWIAAHASGADAYDLLLAKTSEGETSLPSSLNWTKRTYDNTDIYSATRDEYSWHAASFKGVDLLSRSPRLIEEAIRQLNSKYSLSSNSDFVTALQITNKRDALNILVNYGEIGGLLETSFPHAPLNFIDNLGTWAAYDLSLNVDNWMLSGVNFNPDSANSWLSCFDGNSPGSFEASKLLPNNTAQAVMVSMSYSQRYFAKYREYLRRDDRLRLFEPQISELGFDINEVLYSWGGDEFGLISLETSPDAIAQPRVAYVHAEDVELAEEMLKIQADENFIENHRGYLIHKSVPKNLLLLGYGRIFKDMISPYYTFHNDYVIFGNNLLTLKGVINDLMDGRTLTGQATFNEVMNEIPGKGHLRVVYKNPGALGLLRRLVDDEAKEQIDNNFEGLSRIAWAALQYKVDGDVSYSNIYARHEEEYVAEAKQLWAVQLSGEVVGQPQLVLNHYTQKNEVVVQDENHQFYLIDHSGKVLWKRELDGPIKGKVSQVDLFRNGKLQLAFNTEKFIYIVDRNGHDVAPFPVALPENATAPMAVFDYDRARNYRFVIPCGKRVLNYDKEGKQVDGWVFEPTESPVLRQPQHFTVGTRDFIVIREKSGVVHLVSRRGETRIPMEDRLPDTHNDLYLSVGKTTDETRLITFSEGGQLVSLFMNGTVDSTEIDMESNPGDFVFRDNRYVITQSGKLTVKDELHPFQVDLDEDLSEPLYFVRNDTPIYGVVIPDLDQVWLYGQSGDPLPGLPLYGSSFFTVGEFGQRGVLNLIVGTGDGNLLNYKLE
ncbi:MAG: hypothetical protein EP346_11295 [Bacteroidetes bacterium]|nr:MAG: hypothetical protein EP346_11295 [Bacteroidota bacterium]